MEFQKKFVLGISLVALFGTVTNYVFLSPLLTLLFPLAIFVFNKKKLQRPIAWLYLFFGIFLISTIVYDWHALFTFGYYRRDGNFMISYAPLLILPLFSFKFTLESYLRKFYLFVLILHGALYIIHVFNSFPNFHNVIFGGLFYAQNAVGGFLAVIAGLGFSYFYNNRNKKEFFLAFALFIMLLSTYSRGSIIGFILGVVAWYLTITSRFKMLILVIAIPVALTVGSVMIGYPYFKNVIATQSEVETNIGTNDVGGKTANVFIRLFYTFPRAYYLFEHSPIVGTGVGSYNDRPIELKEVLPYVSYNAQPHNAFDSRHAHHSYLHILGEQGIVGLGIFLMFWISLFFYLIRIRGRPVIRDFLLIAYFTLTFAAFTEHRITTPSNMLPFTILLGLFMIQKEVVKTYRMQKVDS